MKKLAALTTSLALGTFLSVTPTFAATTQNPSLPAGFHSQTFASGTASQILPDDITTLNGHIYTAYQNGIPSKGGTGKNGAKQSTIVEYNKQGKVIQKWKITGKCDGMTADTANNRIIATVNEDGNSSLYIITPGKTTPQHFQYQPNPSGSSAKGSLATGGGTDSIGIVNGKYYLSASAPSKGPNGKFTKTALFQAHINTSKGIVTLTSALKDNAAAKDAVTGKNVTLNLSDPDSSGIVPKNSSRFAGDFMLDSQGDKELIFIHNIGSSNHTQTRLALNKQVDDVIWATQKNGTLLISDNGKNKVYSVTGTFQPGTVFASVGHSVDKLNLKTGALTPFVTGLSSSHGMTFVSGQLPSTSTGNSNTNGSSTVKGATNTSTGFPVEELLIEGLALLLLGGISAFFLRRAKN